MCFQPYLKNIFFTSSELIFLVILIIAEYFYILEKGDLMINRLPQCMSNKTKKKEFVCSAVYGSVCVVYKKWNGN